MHWLKNAPVLLWWVGLVACLAASPAMLLCIATLFLLAGPWVKKFYPPVDDHVVAPSGFGRYTALCVSTWMGIVKAGIAQGAIKESRGGLAER